MVTTPIGLVSGFFKIGWTVFGISLLIFIISIIILQFPNGFLSNELKRIDNKLTAKEVTDIARGHLQGEAETLYFLADYANIVKSKKTNG
jgi:hypothetical protein